MIVRFDGCKGCLASGKQPGRYDMKDWWLHQLHLYVKHDDVEHWRKLYLATSWLQSWNENTIRDIMARREVGVRNELKRLGVEL